MLYIENRQIQCIYCGYGQVPGKESTTSSAKGNIVECRWTCPRCARLVRVDERIEPVTNIKKNEK